MRGNEIGRTVGPRQSGEDTEQWNRSWLASRFDSLLANENLHALRLEVFRRMSGRESWGMFANFVTSRSKAYRKSWFFRVINVTPRWSRMFAGNLKIRVQTSANTGTLLEVSLLFPIFVLTKIHVGRYYWLQNLKEKSEEISQIISNDTLLVSSRLENSMSTHACTYTHVSLAFNGESERQPQMCYGGERERGHWFPMYPTIYLHVIVNGLVRILVCSSLCGDRPCIPRWRSWESDEREERSSRAEERKRFRRSTWNRSPLRAN